MSYSILIDEAALKECVESNIYQSSHFETGARLASAVAGDQSITSISPRLTPVWKKETLYLVQSRIETGYLVFDSSVFTNVPQITSKDGIQNDILTVFQRVCRFALKSWNHLGLSHPAERWSPRTDYGVVFPFPKSKHTEFRVTIRKGYEDRRLSVRHGTRHLYAFTGGVHGEATATSEHERQFKRVFETLQGIRSSLTRQAEHISTIPDDTGYHSLTLNAPVDSAIPFQDYTNWIARLTIEQKNFVMSSSLLPQRVEGPAGTGKTLCLLLRATFLCKSAEERGEPCRILFVAHSEATKNAMAIQFTTLGNPSYVRDKDEFMQAIELKTLQEWCGGFLGERDVASSQYLDQDALTAKEMRKLLLKDVVSERLETDPGSLKYLSESCSAFFQHESLDYISELLQHEIAIMIKGRASETLETYISLPYLKYGLPTKEELDRRFIFSLYRSYQALLNSSGVFDTDDIVLTALGRLNTPIWRRRRVKEGYQAVIIDETHLFNLNELSVFHFLLASPEHPRIIFSIDRSQAPGERGITTRMVKEILAGNEIEQETRTKLVFRCAPSIVKLAQAITSAGATLFTTFENPLTDVSSVIPAADEALTKNPVAWKCDNDIAMCRWIITRVESLWSELKCHPSDILIVPSTMALLSDIRGELSKVGKRFIEILQRGDLESLKKGELEGAIILALPDYVGGLEFKAVLIAGVDEGRVPPADNVIRDDSKHFLEFRACNQLYVSITRARLAVEMFFSKERGISGLLTHALTSEAIEVADAIVRRG